MSAMEKPDLMLGYAKDCLLDYGQRIGLRRHAKDARKKLADVASFCGVSEVTVGRWINQENQRQPIGELLVRLFCFLRVLGYQLIEFKNLESLFSNLAELIGYRVLSAEQLGGLLGYSNPNKSIFDSIFRGINMLPERREKLLAIWKDYKSKLDEAKAKAREKYYNRFLAQVSAPGPGRLDIFFPEEERSGQTTACSSPVVTIMDGLLKLLEEELLSEEKIGDLTSHDAQIILELSGRLSSLASKVIGKEGEV